MFNNVFHEKTSPEPLSTERGSEKGGALIDLDSESNLTGVARFIH